MNNRRNFILKTVSIGVASLGLLTSANARGNRKGRFSSKNITDKQKQEIFFMYQEEKVARDVYITLGKLYPNEDTFATIQLAEQRHIDAVEGLCDRYNIDKSNVNEREVGNFVLPELQELYDYCIDKGEENLLEALKIGELIEITDINDLEEASIGMPRDVVNVFSNLKEGSLNHLDAFRRAISRTE